MIELQNTKKHVVVAPQSLTAGATASGYVDTAGYDYMWIDVVASAPGNTNAMTSITVSEADAATGTYATFSGCVEDTDYTLPAQSTSAASTAPYFGAGIDLRPRKRYLKLAVTPATTQVVAALVTLGRAKDVPVGTTEQNLQTRVIV